VPDYDGGKWNFLGQVRTARAYLDGHATDADSPTELWLTETYACTRPNAWWYDDERTAADSVLLTLMLAKAEGVSGVHWFQLADGLWHDKYGVNPTESEYHYGLLHVDRSPKPSLPAFAFAAEMLDGAEFLGWIESPHPDLRGLRFSRDDSGDSGGSGVLGALEQTGRLPQQRRPRHGQPLPAPRTVDPARGCVPAGHGPGCDTVPGRARPRPRPSTAGASPSPGPRWW
jgi:hypothetical protein